MTPVDIIRMAEEADMGFDFTAPGLIAELERFAALVAEAEREICAQTCEIEMRTAGYASGAYVCAQAIRRRGTP